MPLVFTVTMSSESVIFQTLRTGRLSGLGCGLRQRVQFWRYIKFELSLSSSNRDTDR